MSYSDHSMISFEKQGLLHAPRRSHKVRYLAGEDWDFHSTSRTHPSTSRSSSRTTAPQPADRAPHEHVRRQRVVSMKLKVCRSYCRAKFDLEVRASTSDITTGCRPTSRGTSMPGKTLRALRAVCDEDEVVVSTHGHVTFRMWDIQTSTPENTQKEAFKASSAARARHPRRPATGLPLED
ncbi:hypothetical protein B0H10DRAFT_2324624 [Mycena sp. CBHHK59/15]|nr:hypothetical protein B0H10DRAFT_2324624 [Mycena sp. CBHHK59/15]